MSLIPVRRAASLSLTEKLSSILKAGASVYPIILVFSESEVS